MIAIIDASVTRLIESQDKRYEKLTDRIWQLDNELKQNYAPRREVYKLYGNIVQQLDRTRDEILERVEKLPCLQAQCPSETKK